jgi:outer membrane lipoprotein-sorting protein
LFLPCFIPSGFAFAAVAGQASATESAAPAWSSSLESVLDLMDKEGAHFRSVEADFVWDQYQRVVDETDTQKGKIYFRREGKEIQMAAEVTDPPNEAKQVLFSAGKVQLYQPKSNQIDVYSTAKNQEAFESFLLLGFGGGGHSMLNSFAIKYLGEQRLPDGSLTAELQLVPKSAKIRNNFDRFLLWIDSRGISVQQQIFSGSDYKLAKYSNIKLDQKLPENAFTIKKNGKTTVVTH